MVRARDVALSLILSNSSLRSLSSSAVTVEARVNGSKTVDQGPAINVDFSPCEFSCQIGFYSKRNFTHYIISFERIEGLQSDSEFSSGLSGQMKERISAVIDVKQGEEPPSRLTFEKSDIHLRMDLAGMWLCG